MATPNAKPIDRDALRAVYTRLGGRTGEPENEGISFNEIAADIADFARVGEYVNILDLKSESK